MQIIINSDEILNEIGLDRLENLLKESNIEYFNIKNYFETVCKGKIKNNFFNYSKILIMIDENHTKNNYNILLNIVKQQKYRKEEWN